MATIGRAWHQTCALEEMQNSPRDCPVAPPSRSTVFARTLHRACQILGGAQQLAEHLKVPAEDLQRWMEGHEEPPLELFLAAVDVVLLHADSAGRA
jgi:hypothetical protein